MFRRRAVRIGSVAFAGIVVLVVIAAVVVGVIYVRRPFPRYAGQAQLPDLTSEVVVDRDGHGIPQLYADNARDLFRAQGYVQAQDRFFQMDVRRHLAAGRLAELTGPDDAAITSDRLARTLGWYRVAQAEFAALDVSTRAYLEAYADGVNAYLSQRSPSRLSLGYTILGSRATPDGIEPWQPTDSLAWLLVTAWDNRGGDDELARARILGSVHDATRVSQLYPAYPYGEHSPVIDGTAASGSGSTASGSGNTASGGGSGSSAGSAGTTGAGGRTDADDLSGADPFSSDPALETALDSVTVQHELTGIADVLEKSGRLTGWAGARSADAWAVSGALTTTGKPLLADDPQSTTGAPGEWYEIGLHCRTLGDQCPFDVSGFSTPGVPGVVSGHNQLISWGVSNLGADVSDLYVERLGDGTALRNGHQVPLTTRKETIKVAGSGDITLTVRSTSHGPLLSDLVDGDAGGAGAAGRPAGAEGFGLSLAWTGSSPSTAMDGILAIDRATDFVSFRAGAALLDAPAQGLVYADTSGSIGYTAAGAIPVRRGTPLNGTAEGSGFWPQPGWVSTYDWSGTLPAKRLPWELNPTSGVVIAANQAVTTAATQPSLGHDVDPGYRAQLILDRAQKARKDHKPISADDVAALQADTHNEVAEDLVPLLLQVKVNPFTAEAVDLLKGWNFDQPAGSAAAAYFNAVWATLLDQTFVDELPDGTGADGQARWFLVVRRLLAAPRDSWWDDKRTPNVVETRDEILQRAVVQARLTLTATVGKEPDAWRWGKLHRLYPRDLILDHAGWSWLVRRVVDLSPRGMAGGGAAGNQQSWNASDGSFRVTQAPGYRMIVDLADFDRSRWVESTGESGHPGNGGYDDQWPRWTDGKYLTWPFSETAVQSVRHDELRLAAVR